MIWQSPEVSAEDYGTVPPPANPNTPMRGSNRKGGGTMLRRQWPMGMEMERGGQEAIMMRRIRRVIP